MVSLVKNVVHWGSNSNSNPKVKSSTQVDLCEICGKKPKFVDNGFKHPYCSRSCARNGSGSNPSVCLLQGCRATGKPAFANFCSEVHARESVRLGQSEGCELCEVQPRIVGTMCIPCDRLVRAEPRLKELNPDGKAFKNLRAQFLSEWESQTTSASFEKAYEVILPRDTRARHDQYRVVNPRLEEIRSFHSSQCICDLGVKEPVLCNFKSCGICCAVKSCFKGFAFGVNVNNGRFGDGVYSYRNPSQADRYATSCTTSPYRVMIACDIAVEASQVDSDESAAEGESLFVPTPDAILPVYVVMYTTKK